ncbi:MAG TPA: hypothetical protein VF035_05920 [Longimicrobiales bacterium]
MAGKFPEANRHKPRTKNQPADIEKGPPADPAGNREQRRAAARQAKSKANQQKGGRPSR